LDSKNNILIFSPFPPNIGGMVSLASSLVKYFENDKNNIYKLQSGTGILSILLLPVIIVKFIYYMPKIDFIIIIASSGKSLYLKSFPLILIGKIFRKKTFLNFVGGMAVEKFKLWPYYKLLPFIWADSIVVPTKIMKIKLEQKIKENKIYVIPNVVEINTFKNVISKSKKEKPTLLAVKALEKYSGYEYLLHGFKKAKANIKELRLIIVGSGPEEKSINNIIEKNQIEDVEIIKKIEHNDLAKLMNECTIFVHCTRYESFGLVLVEAMASGLPIISSDVGGIPEIINEDYNGLLYNYGDSDTLSKKIIKLLNNQSLLNKFSKNSLELCDQYAWENVKKYWYKILS